MSKPKTPVYATSQDLKVVQRAFEKATKDLAKELKTVYKLVDSLSKKVAQMPITKKPRAKKPTQTVELSLQ